MAVNIPEFSVPPSVYVKVVKEKKYFGLIKKQKLVLVNGNEKTVSVIESLKVNGKAIYNGKEKITPELLKTIQGLAEQRYPTAQGALSNHAVKIVESENQVTKGVFTKAISPQRTVSQSNIPGRPSQTTKVALASISPPQVYPNGCDLSGPVGIEFGLATYPTPFGQFNEDVLTEKYLGKGGREIATNTVTRTASLPSALSVCDNMIGQLREKQLQAKLKGEPEDPILKKKLEFYKAQKANIIDHQKNCRNSQDYTRQGWLPSSYFRGLLKRIGFKLGREKYIAVPPNMRQQKLEFEGANGPSQVQYGRVGVISDMRNGWVSYRDLQRFTTLENGSYNLGKIDEKIKELKGIGSNNKVIKGGNQLESINSAIQELSALRYHLATANGQAALFGSVSPRDGTQQTVEVNEGAPPIQASLPAEAASILQDRELVLEQQMMVYLQDQFASNPEYVKQCLASGKIDVVHVGLLNMAKQKTDDTGWRHDERVQMEDMSAIFEKFSGKKIVFDNSGPRIDGDTVYLSPPPGVEQSPGQEPLTLCAYFFNVSVQGDRTNSGAQLQNNLATVNRMKSNGLYDKSLDNFIKKHKFFEERSDSSNAKRMRSQETTDYDVAGDLMNCFRNGNSMRAVVTTGCLSAKDRTPIAVLMAQLAALPSDLRPQVDVYGIINNEKGSAIAIIKDNTNGHIAFNKAEPPSLPYTFWQKMRALMKMAGKKGED